jgi:predicted DNA-binding transcriptional regulator AlpA
VSGELDDLVSGAEIARRIGVSRERVRQLAEREEFPPALGRVGSAKIWRWSDVERWLAVTGRQPRERAAAAVG